MYRADHADEEASALAAAAALISSLMAFQLSKLLSICVGVGRRTTSQSIHTVDFASRHRVVVVAPAWRGGPSRGRWPRDVSTSARRNTT